MVALGVFLSIVFIGIPLTLAKNQLLLLHALDSHAFKDALEFATNPLLTSEFHDNNNITIISTRAHWNSADSTIRKTIEDSKSITLALYSPHITSLRDASIGRKTKVQERVTSILDGLQIALATPAGNFALHPPLLNLSNNLPLQPKSSP